MDNKLEIHNRLAMVPRTCFRFIISEQSKHKHDIETTDLQCNHQNKLMYDLETIQLTQDEMDKIRPHRFGGEGVLIGVQTATLNAQSHLLI